MAILLIGSTGSGKSTLGNFLIDPKQDCVRFQISKSNLPQTQFVQQEKFRYKRKTLTVIDTPGLNESAEQDLKHMTQIVENLTKIDKVLACVFVVKFNTKIDSQYKATVQYYSKLLPSLFDKNVIIVMTDYATDDRSIQTRKSQGLDIDLVKGNTVREIVRSGSLSCNPMLFTIDCVPFNAEEQHFSEKERSAILDKILSRKSISLKNVKVAKTPFLKSLDQEKVKEYEGEVRSYSAQLQKMNCKSKTALQKVELKEKEVTDKTNELKKMQSDLDDKDSSETVEIGSWSANEPWKFFQRLSQKFDVTVPCEIDSVTKWSNGECQWKDYRETAFRVEGKVEGKFMRGIYAHVTIETAKKRKYKTEILAIKENIGSATSQLHSLKEQLSDIKVNYSEYINEIKQLEKFISERRVLMERLVSDHLSIEEAHERLSQLQGACA